MDGFEPDGSLKGHIKIEGWAIEKFSLNHLETMLDFEIDALKAEVLQKLERRKKEFSS